jgi:hypothetical protein
MEGTRRIDEWMEIQKVLPPDDAILRIAVSPKTNREELTISVDEFRLLAMINGERTLPELIDLSPMGEFVTCRAVYRLIINNLVEIGGRRQGEKEEEIDEEEIVLTIIFYLYNNAFYRIRTYVDEMLGEQNSKFPAFASQYRSGLMNFFPGVDPGSDLMPSYDKFISVVHSIAPPLRLQRLMSNLHKMLSEQLIYVYELLGVGPYRETMGSVKREISEPLAKHRDLLKRWDIEDNFYSSMKQADKVVKLVRG